MAGGAGEGISSRVIFAACWAGMSKKALAKIATPRVESRPTQYVSCSGILLEKSDILNTKFDLFFSHILHAVIISAFYIHESPVYKRFAEGITENLTAQSIYTCSKP